jgi:uncharacterized protein
MTGRELAWRVLANELRASTQVEKGMGEKSPSYLITPLGGRMNRVALAGSIRPVDRATAAAAGFIRTQLTDPTGTVSLTAGSYQPQGQADMEKISAITPALVVGKATLYQPSGATPVASVRVESVQPLLEADYQTLTAEAASQTFDRLELALRLRSAASPSDAELAKEGVSPFWVRGARVSVTRYPTLDPAPYYESLRAVLIALRAPLASEPQRPAVSLEASSPADVVRVVHPHAAPSTPSIPAGIKALEGRLLEILDQLSEESPDGYADMDELAERAARHGLDGERMEELLNYLSENGTLEEPLVGKFRRADGPPRE